MRKRGKLSINPHRSQSLSVSALRIFSLCDPRSLSRFRRNFHRKTGSRLENQVNRKHCSELVEMSKRSSFRIFVAGLYLSMIILFVKFAGIKSREKFDTVDTSRCTDETPCVRICTENRGEVVANETSINFELTNPLTNITSVFSVLNGTPCEKMKILEAELWKFSSVSRRDRASVSLTIFLLFSPYAERSYFGE